MREWRVGMCKNCIFATETDMPCGLGDNYLWCEYGCGTTVEHRWCRNFIPKRKFKRKNIAFVVLCEYEGVQ